MTPLRFAWVHAVRDADLAPNVKLVGLVFASYMDTNGRAFPSVATLMARCSLSRRTVQRALRQLEAEGLLVALSLKGGKGNAGEYRAILPGSKGVTGGTLSKGQRASLTTPKGVTRDAPTVKNTRGRAPESAAHPLEECASCGAEAPLVDARALYCAKCVSDAGEAVA